MEEEASKRLPEMLGLIKKDGWTEIVTRIDNNLTRRAEDFALAKVIRWGVAIFDCYHAGLLPWDGGWSGTLPMNIALSSLRNIELVQRKVGDTDSPFSAETLIGDFDARIKVCFQDPTLSFSGEPMLFCQFLSQNADLRVAWINHRDITFLPHGTIHRTPEEMKRSLERGWSRDLFGPFQSAFFGPATKMAGREVEALKKRKVFRPTTREREILSAFDLRSISARRDNAWEFLKAAKSPSVCEVSKPEFLVAFSAYQQKRPILKHPVTWRDITSPLKERKEKAK